METRGSATPDGCVFLLGANLVETPPALPCIPWISLGWVRSLLRAAAGPSSLAQDLPSHIRCRFLNLQPGHLASHSQAHKWSKAIESFQSFIYGFSRLEWRWICSPFIWNFNGRHQIVRNLIFLDSWLNSTRNPPATEEREAPLGGNVKSLWASTCRGCLCSFDGQLANIA